MFLRYVRRMAAGLVAVAAVLVLPATSKADIQVLVEELDGSNNPISGVTFLPQTGTGSFLAYSFPTFNGQFFSGGGTITLNNGPGTASLTPSFSGLLTDKFDASQDHKILIRVTGDFNNPGFSGLLQNKAGGSDGFASGEVVVVTSSRIYDPSLTNPTPAQIGGTGKEPTTSTTKLADGLTTSGPTPYASNTGPTPTFANVSSLPSPYAIQQEIIISFTGTPTPNGTFGATGGASIVPVPAPGGLALALVGVPLLGLRRVFRKRAAV